MTDGHEGPRTRTLHFEACKVLLTENSSVFRNAVRSVLHGLGFRQFIEFDRLNRTAVEIDAVQFDLWITGHELRGRAVFDVVHAVRHGTRGSDQFLPIVIMCADPTPPIAKRAVDAGADLLWRLPVTGGQVAHGIDALVHDRKPFVVTTDYVGPDRRKTPRSEGQQVPLLDVPNRLRAIATQEDDPISQDEAAAAVNRQKVERHAFQIKWLAAQALPLLDDDPSDEEGRRHLIRMARTGEDLMRRAEHTDYAGGVAPFADLGEVVRACFENANEENLDRLRRYAHGIGKACAAYLDSEVDAALEARATDGAVRRASG